MMGHEDRTQDDPMRRHHLTSGASGMHYADLAVGLRRSCSRVTQILQWAQTQETYSDVTVP